MVHVEEVDPDSGVPESALLKFDSHADALAALSSLGIHGADTAPSFEADDFRAELEDVLRGAGIAVMDMTSSVPHTASAAYQALTVAGVNAGAACRKDSNAAFVIVRSEKNTPSFAFGIHWSLAQTLGKDDCEGAMREVPSALIFFREKQVQLPACASGASVEVAARLAAALLTGDDKYFSCEMCRTPLATQDDRGNVSVSEVAATSCGRLFRRACINAHIAALSTAQEDAEWEAV
jgi:hypothetical protein